MKRYNYIGQMIEIELGQFGYDGYFADIIYKCQEETGKSLITMFLVKKNKDGDPTVILPVQKSQYITASRPEVKGSIVRIVEYMCKTRRIEKYMHNEVNS